MVEWSQMDCAVRQAVREFIDKEIRPHADALESGEMEPAPVIRKLFTTFGIDQLANDEFTKMIAKQKAALAEGRASTNGGKTSGANPMGGAGGQLSMAYIVVSELSRVCMGLVTGMGVSLGLAAGTIQSRGTIGQQERWVPQLLTYEKVGAWAITEPDSGSDAFGGMKTYAKRDGDDYLLNGQKTFCTNGPIADGPIADTVVVYAKLDEGDPSADKRARKVLAFVLDKGMDGFEQGKPFKKMGLHSSLTGELFFSNVRLSKDRLLGETEDHSEGDGRDSARANFATERLGVAAMALGVVEECFALSTDYAKNRVLWGSRSAISSSSSSSWRAWRWPESTCRIWCSGPSSSCRVASHRRSRKLRRSSCTRRRQRPMSRWTPFSCSAATAT